MYGQQDGKIVIDRFCGREPERFKFKQNEKPDEWDIVYVGATGMEGETMPPEKFLSCTWGDDETPYGQGLCRELYPLWFFKANGTKAFVRYTEKVGTGFVLGTYPRGTNQTEMDNFYDLLRQIQANNIGMMPEDANISIEQGRNTEVVALFEFLLDKYVNEGYTKAILGQTTSTESESGTFALAKFQSKGEQHLVEEDAKWEMSILAPVVKSLVDWNFGPQESYPKWSIPYEEEKDFKAMGEGLKTIVSIGVPVTKQYALNRLGLPIPEGVEPDELLEIKQSGLFGANPLDSFDREDEDKDSNLSEPIHLREVKKNVKSWPTDGY